jgi:hypothetical protein
MERSERTTADRAEAGAIVVLDRDESRGLAFAPVGRAYAAFGALRVRSHATRDPV